MWKQIAAVVAIVPMVSCSTGSSDPADQNPVVRSVVCTEQLIAGITIAVFDFVTGAPAGCGARGTVEEGAYVEPLSDQGRCEQDSEWAYLAGAWERAGTYRVTVLKPGYQPWAREGVTVTSDECHVHPVTLYAYIDPL